MVQIEFIKDFANKKKGETIEVDGSLASVLIHNKKVAKKRLRKTIKDKE